MACIGRIQNFKIRIKKALLKEENLNLFISSISLWEIAMLVSKERLKLTMDTRIWLEKFLKITHTIVLEIDPDVSNLQTFKGNR